MALWTTNGVEHGALKYVMAYGTMDGFLHLITAACGQTDDDWNLVDGIYQ